MLQFRAVYIALCINGSPMCVGLCCSWMSFMALRYSPINFIALSQLAANRFVEVDGFQPPFTTAFYRIKSGRPAQVA